MCKTGKTSQSNPTLRQDTKYKKMRLAMGSLTRPSAKSSISPENRSKPKRKGSSPFATNLRGYHKLIKLPILGGSNNAYANFLGISVIIVHCLGWYNDPWALASLAISFREGFSHPETRHFP